MIDIEEPITKWLQTFLPVPEDVRTPVDALEPQALSTISHIGAAAITLLALLIWTGIAVFRRRHERSLPALWIPACAGCVGLAAQVLLQTVPSSTVPIAAFVLMPMPLFVIALLITAVALLAMMPAIIASFVISLADRIAERRRTASCPPLETEQEPSP